MESNIITLLVFTLIITVIIIIFIVLFYIQYKKNKPIENKPIENKPIINKPIINKPIENQTTNFEKSILDLHNKYRKNHDIPELVWNKNLADQSKKWADFICRSNCDGSQIAHSNYPSITMKLGDSNYGENVSWNMNSAGINNVAASNLAVDAWYDEYACYDYNNPQISSKTGHFTQLLWKDTKKVGCAYSLSPDKTKAMTVCQYSPRGNMDTTASLKENVLPCKKDCITKKCN